MMILSDLIRSVGTQSLLAGARQSDPNKVRQIASNRAYKLKLDKTKNDQHKTVKVTERFHILMRDIKQIYHSFFSRHQLNLWAFGSFHCTFFSSGLRPLENSTVGGTL